MSVAVVASFLDEADVAAADETASRVENTDAVVDAAGATASASTPDTSQPGGGARGGYEVGEILLCVALGADRGREAGGVAGLECGLGLDVVAPKVEQRLLERVVRVGEGEEAIQEVVRGGVGAGGVERGEGL
jgi:hypothetical protein